MVIAENVRDVVDANDEERRLTAVAGMGDGSHQAYLVALIQGPA